MRAVEVLAMVGRHTFAPPGVYQVTAVLLGSILPVGPLQIGEMEVTLNSAASKMT